MSMTSEQRVVKGLILGETLGKGTFGYVKLGIKKSTKQRFALKFLLKKNARYNEQAIRTEIECMKRVKHKNVIRLLAHDYNCKYPGKDGKFEETVLMVLEYAPGGDLYDILFYSGKLDEQVTKTYFLQLMDALKAMHNAGVCHRDLKANNILLDYKFRMKVTDFGLSNVYTGGNIAQNRMQTTWVGTKGYQAPEMILNRPFSYKADIFSAGVVVFTLLTGHQPFKSAAATDPWYKCIAAKKTHKFWRSHPDDKLSPPCMNLIESMIAYQPKERWEIDQLKTHPWVSPQSDRPPLNQKQLYEVMIQLHKKAVRKKMKDPKRQERIANSQTKPSRAIEDDLTKWMKMNENVQVPAAPDLIPLLNVFYLQDDLSTKPLEAAFKIKSHADDINAAFNWDPKAFKATVAVTIATESSDVVQGYHFQFWQLTQGEHAGKIVVHSQKDLPEEMTFSENIDAMANVWQNLSTIFGELHMDANFDDNKHDLPEDFVFESQEVEEEIQSA